METLPIKLVFETLLTSMEETYLPHQAKRTLILFAEKLVKDGALTRRAAAEYLSAFECELPIRCRTCEKEEVIPGSFLHVEVDRSCWLYDHWFCSEACKK